MGMVPFVLVAFLLALVGLMLLSTWAMNRLADRMVGARHRAIETIVETGRVPDVWRQPFARRIAVLERHPEPARSARLAELRSRAKARHLAQLDGLLRYAAQSTLVTDEETRTELVEALRAARMAWEAQDADRL